jgi:beta-glucosidase
VDLARRATFTITEENAWNNTWWMDPIFLGKYPEQGLEFYGNKVPKIHAGDLEIISSPIDTFGVNIYQGSTVVPSQSSRFGFEVLPAPVGGPRSAFNWPITPEALYYGPLFFYERYKKPIFITENGMSGRDWVHSDGRVHDHARIDFTERYLGALRRSVAEGADVRGYFHWSIMDNFEWAAGYRERFGLIHVDYETQVRTPKDSFGWYREVIRSNGRSLRI